jgi:hypothetical protein
MEAPPPTVTFDDLVNRLDELWHVLERVSPTEAQCLACVSRRCLDAVVAYVRDHGGLRRLWRAAWPATLVAHRNPARRDWSRTIVHASWALTDKVQQRFETNEQVSIDIDPPASVGEAGPMMAWRVAVEWRASVGRGAMQRYSVARAVIDARDGRLGISHKQRVPCAHRLASTSVTPSEDARVAGLMRTMGWLSCTRKRLRLMAETRCDGSIFLKVAAPEAAINTATNLPHIRILPSSDLRAVFWLYSRALSSVPPPMASVRAGAYAACTTHESDGTDEPDEPDEPDGADRTARTGTASL